MFDGSSQRKMWLKEEFRIWGLIYHPKGQQSVEKRLDKEREVWGFWAVEARYRKVIRKSR